MDFLLLRDYQGQDVSGGGGGGAWLMSEKIDGFRALWDGRSFWSREGNRWEAPQWFTDGLPEVMLDGEVHLGRGGFNGIRGAMRDGWHGLIFSPFDMPEAPGGFRQRLAALRSLELPPHVQLVDHVRCRDTAHLVEFANAIVDAGGEGAVVRDPKAPYVAGRSGSVLRWVPVDPALNRRKVA